MYYIIRCELPRKRQHLFMLPCPWLVVIPPSTSTWFNRYKSNIGNKPKSTKCICNMIWIQIKLPTYLYNTSLTPLRYHHDSNRTRYYHRTPNVFLCFQICLIHCLPKMHDTRVKCSTFVCLPEHNILLK
jgi:hypothetical protein